MNGKLILIGGGETQPERNTFKSKILSELFHKQKKILVVIPPGPKGDLEKSIRKHRLLFNKIISSDPEFLILEENKKTKKDDLKVVSKASLIFFSGGQQEKVIGALSEQFIELIQDRFKKDDELILAGTSAGAMIFSKHMISEGSNEESQVDEFIKLTSGLNLLPHVIVDTHFIERGRFARLAQVIKKHTNCLGIGIESDTAVLFEKKNEITTYGRGTITVIEGSQINARRETKGCIFNLRVHLLSSGCSVNMDTLSS